jgi:exodeoxyribonuclease VII large subunit
VTSSTGAAIRDIISIIRRRAPHVRIILRETQVQGEGAAEDIVAAIRDVNRYTDADVMIVGRGGGSIEDLWCFNEEIVSRAIASSRIPVVSAVGHETDYTLSDFAADLRAPTPSAAAELVVRDSEEIRQMLTGYQKILRQRMLSSIDDLSQSIGHLKKRLSPERLLQTLALKSQDVDELSLRMKNACLMHVAEKEKLLESLKGKLYALNPEAVLERGYSIVFRDRDSQVVTRYSMVQKKDAITVKLAKGSLGAVVGSAYE